MQTSAPLSFSTVECVPKACWASAYRSELSEQARLPLNLRLTCSATSQTNNKVALTTKASPMLISRPKALEKGFWESEHACGFSLG